MDTHIRAVDGPAPGAGNSTVVGCPASAPGCPMASTPAQAAATLPAGEASLGCHLVRASSWSASATFAVPGDFNLTLLDHMIAKPGLRLVGCCNELNAG